MREEIDRGGGGIMALVHTEVTLYSDSKYDKLGEHFDLNLSCGI